jgi:hypothetical protein
MKAKLLIPPAIALILLIGCIGPQRRSMAAVETECARLRAAIAAVKSQSVGGANPHDPLEKRRNAMEWKLFAEQFPGNPRGISLVFTGVLPDERLALRVRQRMKAMSTAEVIATLDEIAAFDLSVESRANLEWTLFDDFAWRDPATALELMERRGIAVGSDMYWQLSSRALEMWARKDAVAAEAWLDRQIAAGKFKSKALAGGDGFRQEAVESALIRALLSVSPETATLRVAALSEYQRGKILSTYSMDFVPEVNQLAHAELVRAQVPVKDQAKILANQASLFLQPGDYSTVTDYLERIGATPAERAASVLTAATKMNPGNPGSSQLTRQDFDRFREWVTSQAPDSIDTATGTALGEAAQENRRIDFAAAAALAAEYARASPGSDEVLATFLSSEAAIWNKVAARALAKGIADEARRSQILEFLQ